jgi:Basic region leucine zipper
VLHRRQQIDSHQHRQQQQQHNSSIFDFSFEHDSFPSSSSSSSSPSIPLADLSSSSLWEASYQVESLDQLAGVLDLDFLLADPTSGLGSTDSQFPGPSVASGQQGELSFDLSSLGFGGHDHTSFDIPATQDRSGLGALPTIGIVEDMSSSSSYSPVNMSEGAGVFDVNMNGFYSTNTPVVVSSSAAAPTTTNIAVSPLSMTSLPSQDYHHQQQPFLAPKQYTPPSSSSSSPALSSAVPIAVKSNNTMQSTTSRKRSRAAAAEPANVDLSGNNSAQDSEEERTEKRRRNTMAARRFRKRKQDHVEDLQSQLSTVTKERDDLKLQVAKWEGEAMALRKLLEMKQ